MIYSANGGAGVLLVGGSGGSSAMANLIQGNNIGTDASGRLFDEPAAGKQDGVSIQSGASNNTIRCVHVGSSIGGTIMLDPAWDAIRGEHYHDGVVITATSAAANGNRVSQNVIYSVT